MPKVIRILETCLHVKDVERSARFAKSLVETSFLPAILP